jgi:hypothetical protein
MKVMQHRRSQDALYVVTMSNTDHFNIGRAIEIARQYFKDHAERPGVGPEELKTATREWQAMRGLSARFNDVEDI